MIQLRPISAFLIVSLLLLSFGTMAPAVEAGDRETGLLQIPLRWCGMRGSPTVDDPSSIGESDLDLALWHRHERASDNVWIPGANITFRSGFTAEVRDNANFPIIDDPQPDGPGMAGDILDPQEDRTELNEAIQACEDAWDTLVTDLGLAAPLLGPVVINIRQFVDAAGNPVTLRGQGGHSLSLPADVDSCREPDKVTGATGWVVITDYSFIRSFDPNETILAHEFGHVLFLGHGNGLDDDDNGIYDQFCDPDEDPDAEPETLMSTGSDSSDITQLQKETSRAIALVHSGTQIDPPAVLINGDTISDQRVDTIQEVADDAVDIAWVSMTEHTPSNTTIFTHKVFGVIPLRVNNQYVVFADLDNNAATGGAPESLGFSTSFQGAELVTRVVVSFSAGDPEFPFRVVRPTLWRFEGGSFTEVSDPNIRAQVFTSREAETNVPMFDTVSIQFPKSVRGSASDRIRIQALSEQRDSGEQLDRLPNASLDGGLPLIMIPPTFPVCAVTPSSVQPGAAAVVEVSGLVPNQAAKVLVGEQLVATGTADEAGNVNINFGIPRDSRTGPRLVTVGSQGTALSADCTVEVAGEPVPNQPPTVAVDQVSVAVDEGQTASNTGTISDPNGDAVTLTASVGTAANNNDGTWSWSFTATDGPAENQTVIITADDGNGGNSQISFALTVNNVAPTPDAGMAQTVFRNDVVEVIGAWFDPAGSRDNQYAWSWDLNGNGIPDGSGDASFGDMINRVTSFSLEGIYTLTFEVTDKDGGTGRDTVNIEVLNRPPDCSQASPSIELLWPPDHKFEEISVLGVTDPEGDDIIITIESIFQDEPVNDKGDGSTTPDGKGVGTNIAEVRAERKNNDNGRVYHINFIADDGHGGTCTSDLRVGVPKSTGKPPVDDGMLFDSTRSEARVTGYSLRLEDVKTYELFLPAVSLEE